MKDKKDWFRKAEGILYSYNDLLEDIRLIEEEIKLTKKEYRGCGGLEYGEKSSPTNKFSSVVENEFINKEKYLRELENTLTKSIKLKNRIESAVSKLEGVDKKVIELRYINKRRLSWKEIANVVNFSEEHCRQRIRVRSIKRMISTIFFLAGNQERFEV